MPAHICIVRLSNWQCNVGSAVQCSSREYCKDTFSLTLYEILRKCTAAVRSLLQMDNDVTLCHTVTDCSCASINYQTI